MGPSADPLFSRNERLVLALGALLLAALAGGLALRGEIADARHAFAVEAQSLSLQVSRRLAEGETLIAALHGVHHSADEVTDARFPSIAERFLDGHPHVRWMAYAEQVEAGGERDFERRLDREGFVGLRVRPFPDARPSDPETGLRLPIYRLEPLTPTEARLLGADLMSREQWRPALEEAVDSATIRAVATRLPELGLEGVLLLRATYRGNVEPDNPLERRQQLAGMLLLFVDAADLMADLITSIPGAQSSLALGEAAPWDGATSPDTDWSPQQATVIPLSVADLQLPLRVVAPLEPELRGIAAPVLLASLFALSLLHGLRLRRVARRDERQAFVQAQLAEITLHSIGEAVIRLDDGGRVRYMNPVAEALSGVDAASARGRLLEDVLSLAAEGPITARTLTALADSRGGIQLSARGGHPRAVACTLSPISDAGGALVGRVLVMRDVSREHELSRELAYQATHDPLTELPNRREFERRLARAVVEAHAGTATHSLFYVDLDQFKLVNDTCGHAAGDRMLRQIAGLLAAEVRQGDVLARLGGDEFGVLLTGCPVSRALPIAERICGAVCSFRFMADGRAFELGASIGVVEIGRDSGTVGDVQRAADLACYAAKDTGRSRVHLYRHEDQVIARHHRDMQWHAEIKAAIEEDRLVLHAQPIRRLRDRGGPADMHELLLRLVNADGGLVPPMAFLPAAERYGLMGVLDRTVIEKAFTHAAGSRVTGHAFAINLSGQSLTDSELGDFILATASRIGVDPHHVCFEVTETTAISNLAHAGQLMQRLRGEGFRFALDDFGAGLSSFGYLKQLPVDFIKIDGQFVREINSDPVARAMVTGIVNVARVLAIQTVAEKVESEAGERCLESLGVDYVQGFHVGAPAPLAHVIPLARTA